VSGYDYLDRWFEQYVYVISDDERGRCKIGRSFSPTNRWKTIKRDMERDLSLEYMLDCGKNTPFAKLVEKTAHKRLQKRCVKGREWFEVTPRTAIRAVKMAYKECLTPNPTK